MRLGEAPPNTLRGRIGRRVAACCVAFLVLGAPVYGQDKPPDDYAGLIAASVSASLTGDHSGAEALARRALDMREAALGPDHPDVAAALVALGNVYRMQNRASEAAPFYRRALAIQERALGAESAALVPALESLAFVEIAQRRYAEAEPLYRRALAIREKATGPDDISLVATLGSLASLLSAQKRDAEALRFDERALKISEKAGVAEENLAPLLSSLARLEERAGRFEEASRAYERVLAIREKQNGADSLEVASALIDLAWLRDKQKRLGETERLYRRALVIRENALGADHADVGWIVAQLAVIAGNSGRYAEAERLYLRSNAIREKSYGSSDARLASGLNNLGLLYVALARHSEALPLFMRALAIHEATSGPDSADVASDLLNIAALKYQKGELDESERLFRRCLQIREKLFEPDSDMIAQTLNYLAVLLHGRGRYAEAEPLYKRALAIREKTLDANDPWIAWLLNGLGELYLDQGRDGEAAPLIDRALAIREKALGPDDPQVAASLTFVANRYRLQGRSTEAEALYKRALSIREKAFGPDHPEVARSLATYAVFLRKQGRYDEAEAALKRSLTIREKTLGADHPEVAYDLDGLADLYDDRGRPALAATNYERSLAIREKKLGPDHPQAGSTLDSLGTAYFDDHRYDKAKVAYERALSIREKSGGANDIDVARTLANLADTLRAQGRNGAALVMARRGVAIRAARLANGLDDRGDDRIREQKGGRWAFLMILSLLARQSDGASSDPAIVEEAFRNAQYAGGLETARALAGMAARFASGSDALAALVRQRQDLRNHAQSLDAALAKAVSQTSARDAPREEALRAEIAADDRELAAIDRRLQNEFPRFAELASARPATIAEVQKSLARGEALVLWSVAATESYGFALTRDHAQFFSVPMTRGQIASAVTKLRDALEMRDRLMVEMPAFDTRMANDLYRSLFGPAEALLREAKSLILVPDGALQSLPLSVLVTRPVRAPVSEYADYKSVPWLARRHVLTVLPAASSLVVLRKFAENRTGTSPFAGFGDPDFAAGGGADKLAEAKGERIDLVKLFRGASADIEGLRQLPPLPETADELRRIARALNAPASSIYLGREATVRRVASLDLSGVRVLAFATHGLVAGDLPKLAEPALALTPPAEPSDEDDGLLRASQVSQLKLNADWVLLSACNTASADGSAGAEGLSGLAKAFFYAGARTLLVSHWQVDSEAAAQLTTGSFDALERAPKIGRAGALQRSMLAMLDGAGRDGQPDYRAHPLFWAPFVVVGEGGALLR